tara:strand:- start:5258 stop:6061 length:804 start_codon:yes stop_codon:yes gene_type:complete
MNILVTGHMGFIGSRVVKRYKELGHNVYEVNNGLEIDICSDRYIPDLQNLLSGNGIDVISHHAAQSDVRKALLNPEYDAKQNILATLKILQVCKMFDVKKIIYASSGGACYGNPENLPVLETDLPNPISPYGLSKLVAEKYIKLSEISYTILRYANVWGEDAKKGIYYILRKNPEPRIYGTGETTRDYVHIDDVVEANVLALHKGKNEIFNIGTGEEVSLNQLVNKYGCLHTNPIYFPKKKNEVERICLDNRKAKKMLGWVAKKRII